MASPELIALWSQIEADLRRARATLPSDASGLPSVRDYEEYLTHNELELACDMLESYSDDHAVSREFWLALKDASLKMGLTDRATTYDLFATAD